MEEEFYKEEFYKLDALLDLYIKEEGNIFTIDILQLVNLIDSKLPNINWKSKDWKKVLEETNPPLKNVILLLENEEFREIKFEGEDFGELGFSLDSPKLFSSYFEESNTREYFLKSCRQGKINMVKYFHKVSRDPGIIDDRAIRRASEYGHLEVVKYLHKEVGCDPTSLNNWAIIWASENGHLEVVKYLHEAGCDPTVGNNYPLAVASRNGHLEVVKYLHEAGCDLTINNWAIIWASENGRLEVVKYLHEAGCDPTFNDNWVIRWVSSNGHLQLLKYLYEEANCDPTVDDNRAIKMACANGHLEVVEYLQSIGCTLD